MTEHLQYGGFWSDFLDSVSFTIIKPNIMQYKVLWYNRTDIYCKCQSISIFNKLFIYFD